MTFARKPLHLALLLVLVIATAFMSGCNTMEGLGQDVSSVGQGLSDVASDARD